MRVLITGAGGMIGRKLTARLVRDGALNNASIEKLTLIDVSAPEKPETFAGSVDARAADIAEPAAAAAAVGGRPDVIFHLAAVVSGEAELDFEKGTRVNLDGSRALLEAVRRIGDGYRPRLVFTSSIAVFGAPFPEAIPDEFQHTPLTSYGTQKAIVELLLADYTRRGFLDGVGIRLPTINVRPGKPNRAASGFFSSIIREPLDGAEAVLPVDDSVMHWHASPRAATGFLIHAAAPSRSPRCAASPATGWRRVSAAPPIRWWSASSPAGRDGSIRSARGRSASPPRAHSMRSSASTSTMSSAARLRPDALSSARSGGVSLPPCGSPRP
jgi:nucleoside-diphosphate-sugar epimerase